MGPPPTELYIHLPVETPKLGVSTNTPIKMSLRVLRRAQDRIEGEANGGDEEIDFVNRATISGDPACRQAGTRVAPTTYIFL